jgi:hypothetical protein
MLRSSIIKILVYIMDYANKTFQFYWRAAAAVAAAVAAITT